MEEIEHREVAGERVAFVGETGIPVWHVVAGVRELGDPRRVAGKLHLNLSEVWTALRYASMHDFEIQSAFRDRSGGEPPPLRRPRAPVSVADQLRERPRPEA